MRILWALVLLTSMSSAATAQAIERIDILEAGLFSSTAVRRQAAPGTALGETTVSRDFKLTQATTKIPGRLGVNFGITYKIVGRGTTSSRLKVIWLIPAPGIRNPNTGNTIVRDESFWNRTPGSTDHNTYVFENAWEIVPGDWTIELWDGNRKLASQRFTVRAP